MTRRGTAVAAWSAALDEIEATLQTADALVPAAQDMAGTVDAAASAVAGQDAAAAPASVVAGRDSVGTAGSAALAVPAPEPLAGWAPPEGLGPLPAELAPRAEVILAAVGAVQAQVAEQRDAVGAELAEMASAARTPGRRSFGMDEAPAARFVDHDA